MKRAPIAFLLLAAAAALLTPPSEAAADDLYTAINGLRAGSATCARAANLQPLRVEPQLEKAAAAVARGAQLGKSLKDAGYRADRSTHIEATGDASDAQLLALLQNRYCAQLLDPGFAGIGIHRGGRRLSIVLAAPFAPQVNDTQEAAAQKILVLVNAARAAPRNCGSTPYPSAGALRWNDALAAAARVHAADMARFSYLSHQGRDGSRPAQRVARAGYRYRATGENIAAGQFTPEDAVAGWIKSPTHCANLMNPVYTETGAAYAVNSASELGVYWAQVFGARP